MLPVVLALVPLTTSGHRLAIAARGSPGRPAAEICRWVAPVVAGRELERVIQSDILAARRPTYVRFLRPLSRQTFSLDGPVDVVVETTTSNLSCRATPGAQRLVTTFGR